VAGKKTREEAAEADRDIAGEEEVEGAVDPSAGRNVGGGNWNWVAFGWCCSLGDMKKVEEEELRVWTHHHHHHHHHYTHPNSD
jgi:hypothetical protein